MMATTTSTPLWSHWHLFRLVAWIAHTIPGLAVFSAGGLPFPDPRGRGGAVADGEEGRAGVEPAHPAGLPRRRGHLRRAFSRGVPHRPQRSKACSSRTRRSRQVWSGPSCKRLPLAGPVSVEIADGAVIRTVDNPRGHHSRPLGADELRAKFDHLVGNEHAALWWPRLTTLHGVVDCADVLTGPR